MQAVERQVQVLQGRMGGECQHHAFALFVLDPVVSKIQVLQHVQILHQLRYWADTFGSDVVGR